MNSETSAAKLRQFLSHAGRQQGFDVFGVSPARLPADTGRCLDDFVAAGRHGEMHWMKETLHRRRSPHLMWPDARSAVIFGCNYGPADNPLETLKQRGVANISVYARGRDYHDVLKGRLKQIAGQLQARTKWQVKVFVDTAPLLEKPLAGQAGLGWQGKHTNLVSRDYGSWLFLGTILTDGEIAADRPAPDSCGSCSACLDICPTNAFPAPYQLDARRCISYLTIEYDGHIPLEFRQPMGNRVFGCDDCLAVCPWNKFAAAAQDIRLSAADSSLPALAGLLAFDEPRFRQHFSASPVKRTGYIRFTRNLLIAAGNAGDPQLAAAVIPYLRHADSRLRAMAVWALSQYMDKEQLSGLCPADEADRAVQAEWQQALSRVKTHHKQGRL